jgi:signal transduction histidine kinase/ligand-binding sensor domain-containing protein
MAQDGLAGDTVGCAAADRHGFLWFGTNAGISRFDGRSFRSFGREHGLPDGPVRAMLADEDGALWVAAASGLFRFEPGGGGSFDLIVAIDRNSLWHERDLARDGGGTVWFGADRLYRIEAAAGGRKAREVAFRERTSRSGVAALLADPDGNVWVGSDALYRIAPGGQVAEIPVRPAASGEVIDSIVRDDAGRLWAGTTLGPCVVAPRAGGARAEELECRRFPENWPPRWAWTRLLARPGGGVWAGTRDGISEIDPVEGVLRTLTSRQGFRTDEALPLLVDGRGDLWVSFERAGVARLAGSGIVAYGPREGLLEAEILSVMETRKGETVLASRRALHRFERGRLTPIRPAVPESLYPGWGRHQINLEDREGGWWFATGEGIVRFAPVRRLEDLERARPAAIYTTRDGLANVNVFRIFEDSRGDVWAGTFPPGYVGGAGPLLSRWDRASGRFHNYGPAQGVPDTAAPTAFFEDREGTLWIGLYDGRVLRRRGGAFETVLDPEGPESAFVGEFHQDARGRLWIATEGAGLLRLDDPAAAAPSVHRLTAADGLASDRVRALAGDDGGRIYLGTDLGVDVLDPASGRIRHLGTAEGLPHPLVNSALFVPGVGVVFGTQLGAAVIDPAAPERTAPPPAVRIDGLRVGGVGRPLSALGEPAIEGLVLRPDERQIEIDFLGIGGTAPEEMRFQHRLGPEEAWSAPVKDRSVVLARMAPGTYRFEVRAFDGAGAASPQSAVLGFQVLAPVWRRPWFLALAGASLLAGAAAVYRARVAHLLALERQRTQIAMDLHDEVGSGLGSIGLLADLLAEAPEEERGRLADQIGGTAAELGSSMSDIVWSLRTGSETLDSLARELVERGRRLFPAGVVFTAEVPSPVPDVALSLGARRNALLIGLEALHNAARHAAPSRVSLSLARDGRRWRLSVADDGRGLGDGSAGRPGGGMGLGNMRRRAEGIGADLDIRSAPGAGTTVTLTFDPRAEERRKPGGAG